LGLPRLVECTFRAARTLSVRGGTALDQIRTEVQKHFNPKEKYANATLRRSAVFAAFTTYRMHTEQRAKRTSRAEKEGYLFRAGTDSPFVQIPPVILRWWLDLFANDTDVDTKAVLKAVSEIVSFSDLRSGDQHGKPWEKQLAHLWRILTVVDRMWRVDQKEQLPRTLLGQLGQGSELARDVRSSVHPRAYPDKTASFNYLLEEVDSDQLMTHFVQIDKKPGKPVADVPRVLTCGVTYFPGDENNPGFDFAVADKIVDHQGTSQDVLLTLVEAKFSSPISSTKLTKKVIIEKFGLMLRDRPHVQKAFIQQRLCYVIGGLREPQKQVMKKKAMVIKQIAKQLPDFEGLPVSMTERRKLVWSSLVVLTRQHVEALLTPSLAGLPPFASIGKDGPRA
jgi:hypothetical protein